MSVGRISLNRPVITSFKTNHEKQGFKGSSQVLFKLQQSWLLQLCILYPTITPSSGPGNQRGSARRVFPDFQRKKIFNSITQILVPLLPKAFDTMSEQAPASVIDFGLVRS